MRPTAINVATFVFALGTFSLSLASTPGCRPYRAAPVGVPAAAGEVVRPSGVGTRTSFKLPNGLGVVLEENHAAPVVAIHATVAAGAAHDPAGQEGVAYLVEHALLTATKGRPFGQVARDIAAVGGRLGGWTSHDQTVFHAVVAAPFADVGLAALADVLRQPDLTAAAIEAARRAARDAARQDASASDRFDTDAALALAFAGHAYARPVVGTDATLNALGPAAVSSFFERCYGPASTTLVIVGDFDPAVVRARVTDAFGGWRSGATPADIAATGAESGPSISVFTANVSTPHVVIGFRTPGIRDRSAPALELLAAVLGAGRAGRLEVELARNRQLATGARARLFAARAGGLLLTTATLGPGRVDDAVRAALDEMLRLGREKVSADELERARTRVEADGAAAKTGLDGYARKLALSVAMTGDPAFESSYLERQRGLDAGDLVDVAAATFRPAQLAIVAILPAARGGERDDRVARLTERLRAVAATAEPRAAKPIADGPVSATGRDVVDYLLPSGVRVLVLRDDSAPQTSVRAVWSGGVRLEDARLAGATSLLARLLPRESKTRGVERMAAELGEIGGQLDGLAAMDSLGLRGDFLAARWERGLELLVDCLRNPRLSDDEVERERRVMLDAIRARDDDPTAQAQLLFQGALFGRHPYRLDLLGTPDSVAGLTRRRLLDHYRRAYGPRGLTVAVVGAVDPARVAAKVQSLFADAPPPSREGEPTAVVASPARTEPLEVFQSIARPQARVVVGYPGLTVRDPDRFALEVLAETLSGPEGRLAALRDRVPGVEAATALSREGVEPGFFSLTLAARPDQLDASVVTLRAELGHLVEAGVTEVEVARARRYLMGVRALALERRSAIALALALHGAFGEAGRSYRRDVDELGRVTAADVLRVARRIIDPRRQVVAVVRPREGDRTSSLVTPRPARTVGR